MNSGRPRTLALALLALILSWATLGRTQTIAEPDQVTVERPTRTGVTDHLDSTGTFQASASAKIVARVDGFLDAIHFRDGALVSKGDLLFTIEQDTYLEQVKLYQAQLTQAQSEYQRQLRLIAKDATSETQVEKWQAKRDEASANLALAKINLGYTQVKAPFAGLMGRHLVDTGNLVGPNTGITELAELDRIAPIYLYFSLNAPDAMDVRQRLLASSGPNEPGAPVLAALGSSNAYKLRGRLDFVDTSIDQSSGTIQLRAVFDNKDDALIPGIFARVRVPLGQPIERLAVPNRAVQEDQAGAYLLVADKDDRVQKRRVQVGGQVGELRVVTGGLAPDDRVIVEGLAYAREGERVKVRERAP